MRKKFLIREATLEDSQEVCDLVVLLFEELNTNRKEKFEIDVDAYHKTTRSLLENKEIFTAFLAYDEEDLSTPVAVLTLVISYAIYNQGAYGTITELYVDPAYRSQGLGHLLVEKSKVYCINRGWNKLEVGAPPKEFWGRTISFYEGMGFNQKGPKLRLDI